MKRVFFAVALLAASARCARQERAEPPPPARTSDTARSGGQVVSELDDQIRSVFQAKDAAYWFGSDGHGVYRWVGEGKPLVRFTTEDGLSGNQIRSIQQDRAGNLFVLAEGGVSMFDGRGFRKLIPLDPSKSEWRLGPDDLWFAGESDTGAVYRWDGASLHRLTFPATEAGDAHNAAHPRSKYPNAKYSPYDVYTIFKDSNGRLWFGTAVLGACRYDGSSFVWVGAGENGSFGVRSIVEDKDGKFWLSNCLHRFAEGPAPTRAGDLPHYRKEPGLATHTDPYSVFVSTLRDQDGVLWMATLGGGVFRYDGTAWTHFPVTNDGKPMWLFQIDRDLDGRVWLGTQGHGVYRFDGAAFTRVRL